MEKIINIDGIDVPVKSNASILLSYRTNFGGDLIKDIVKMQNSIDSKKSGLEQLADIDLDMFTKLLWCMAKAYDSKIPPLEKWLEQFNLFSVLQAMPEIMELLTANLKQNNEVKKK